MRNQLSNIHNPEARLQELQFRLGNLQNNQIPWLLMAMLVDPYLPIRHYAASELAHYMAPDIVECLRYLAQAQSIPAHHAKNLETYFPGESLSVPRPAAEVQIAAIHALKGCSSQDHQTRQVLMEVTLSPNPDARYQAMVSLHHLGLTPDQWLSILPRRLRDNDHEVVMVSAQIAAHNRLYSLLDHLWQAHDSLSGDLKLQLTFSLAELVGHAPADFQHKYANKIPDLVHHCLAALENEITLAGATQALATLGHDLAIEPLRKTLQKWFIHPVLKVGAAAALFKLGEDEGQIYLEQSLHSSRKDARGYAIRLIGQLHLRNHIPFLTDLAQSTDYHADTAVLALSDFDLPELYPLFEQLSQNHPDEDVRLVAQQCLKNSDTA